jgi:Tfp pilus assembly protein PilF
MRRSALAFTLVLGCLATACSTAKRDAIVFSNQAIEQFQAGDWRTARGYCLQSLELDPDNGSAHYHLGLIHLYEDPKPEEAGQHLERAQALDPTDPEVAYHLGRLELDHGSKDKARAELARATQLDPNHAGAWHTRGRLERAEQHLLLADTAWREAIAIDPGRAESYLAIATLYDELDYPESAKAVLLAGQPHVGRNPDLGNMLGVFELRDGNPSRAVELFTAALANDPDRLDAAFNLAFALHEDNKRDQALRVLQNLIARPSPEYREQIEVAKALRAAILREPHP